MNMKKSSRILSFIAAAAIPCLCAAAVGYAFPDAKKALLIFLGAAMILMSLYELFLFISERRSEYDRDLRSLEAIADKLNIMAVLWSTSFDYFYVNDAFIRATGYTAEDLKDPANIRRVLPPDAFSDNLQGIVNTGNEEFVIQCKTGGGVCTTWNTSIMAGHKTPSGHVSVMLSMGRNLNEKQRMQQELISYSEKLRESENKYALSLELSEIGLLLREAGQSGYYASDRLCRIFDIRSDNGHIGSDALINSVHPDDRVIFETFEKTDIPADESVRSVDFRANPHDGKYRWYTYRYKSISDSPIYSMGGAVIDITADKEKDMMIEKMAYVDEVTGISNRNRFMLLGSELLACTQNDMKLDYWVIVLDIDSFHLINDTCGYSGGDMLLKKIGEVISKNLEKGGFSARIGGDNFAILLKKDGDERTPVLLIRRLQLLISRINLTGEDSQNITCSAGYCLMSDGSSGEFAQVLDRAEFALDLAGGERGAITRYDNHLHNAVIENNEFEKALIRAVENNELVLYYQPKINLENGGVIGMEALIRWIKPDGTIIPPSRFIPVAEKSMLITKISHFVLHEACRQNKEWQDKGLSPVTVSVNLTAVDFYRTNVTESIREALRVTGLPPCYLDVELTESLALKDIEHAVDQMQEIKNLGVKLSMDDFGTGYSSLSYIQILPITVLKLDRSFIMYLEEDEISREIVSAVIRIAKSKKIETIAEGIETSGQAEILKKSGCDHAQGYFFGKPMPANEFEEFLRKRSQTVTEAK